jgi:MSHA pilin protein MshA
VSTRSEVQHVLVIVILGILSAVAIPAFINLQEDAKRSAVRGSLGGLRSGIAIWYAYKAASGTATYPTLAEMQAGTVMQFGVPLNPYTNSTGIVAGTSEYTSAANGWIYDAAAGRIYSSAAETQGSNY